MNLARPLARHRHAVRYLRRLLAAGARLRPTADARAADPQLRLVALAGAGDRPRPVEMAPLEKYVTDVLTVGLWLAGLEAISELCLSRADIISFHCYLAPEGLLNDIARVEAAAEGRPIICTEYMARTMGSTFHTALPLLAAHNMGAINWGLVAGKSQTIYPWQWDQSKGEPELYFHDVLRPDGTMLYGPERDAIRRVTQK